MLMFEHLPNTPDRRHLNAIVVRDRTSQRLEIRGVSECPTCHQPLRPTSPDRSFEPSTSSRRNDSFVDPDYFRMLRVAHGLRDDADPTRPPTSPVRRLVESTPSNTTGDST